MTDHKYYCSSAISISEGTENKNITKRQRKVLKKFICITLTFRMLHHTSLEVTVKTTKKCYKFFRPCFAYFQSL